ncbi:MULTISPECIES: patatin-like phospholipase family protein [unclassified Stenotrophomonas]|uniref:patatin-like phospholipase family protein n=1 Tax=unclassified Stenotrophomonas TaxID=196198 RepID=UPI0022448B78|nr:MULTISPECIES: patatin-like phospholipase family protein [unclassified Stenotrophomonas]MCW8340597.1 patatin-like phospholipase family protein [Stenotrophomonas sp. SG1]
MTSRPIDLVLSGGGIRAMVFHLGVMKALAEAGHLEDVLRISSVSGGSLIIGLVLHKSGMQWPSSEKFLSEVYPAVRAELTSRSLQWDALRELCRPANLRFLLSRSNLLASALRRRWDICQRLADLPESPDWSINGTNAENGRRFRFKRADLGDYLTGYAPSGNFPLASAMAVSAAFPGGFGPLRLRVDRFKWRRRARWDASKEDAVEVQPDSRAFHLYDGGVYDNLGLEPFFDAGRGVAKTANGHFILVSDAGRPLDMGFSKYSLNPFRIKRVADIMSDQSHALRVRTFHHYLSSDATRGGMIYIGDPAGDEDVDRREARFVAAFPTSLLKLSATDFDRIANHGRALTRLPPPREQSDVCEPTQIGTLMVD